MVVALPEHLKPDGVVMGVQNGMNDETIFNVIGCPKTPGCAVELAAEAFTPGEVFRKTPRERTWFGIGGNPGIRIMLKRPSCTGLLVCLLICCGGANAQDTAKVGSYPTKPIRFVVPYTPGGTPDIQGRTLAEKIASRLGQPVVIDNRPGASGTIGMGIVARAPADGHTIIIAPVGPWAVSPHLYKLDFDVLRDLIPVIQVATTPGVLLVHPSVPARTVKELIDLARRRPGDLNYGSSGVGGFGHISGELFALMSGIRMTLVPYKGVAAALTDLAGGHIQVLFNSAAPSIPHIRSSRIRALATTGAKRMEVLPELPTVAEAGVAGYENSTWSAIGVPAKTPRPIVERLNAVFKAVLALPEVIDTNRAEGSAIVAGTPEEAQAHLRHEFAKFAELIRKAGIRAEADR